VGEGGRRDTCFLQIAGMIPLKHPPVESNGKASQTDRVVAFLLGLGSRLNVRLIGYLPFSELAILLAFPFLLPKLTSREVLKRTVWILPLASLWLVSLILTDLYRETVWTLSARGIARIIIFMTAIPFAVYFLRRATYEKLLWFTLGSIPSTILSAFFFRSGVHEGRELVYGSATIDWQTHWSGLAGAVAGLATLVFYKRNHAYAYGVSFALGVVNLLKSSRSVGAILLLGPLVTIAYNTLAGRGSTTRNRVSTLKIAGVAVFAIGFAVLIFAGYSFAAKERLLGEREFAKFDVQSRNPFGVLVGGRPSLISSYLAISQSPFVGYGSWPIDKWEFNARALQLAGYKIPSDLYKKGYPLIDSHSHVFQAWVESGVFGAIFWLYIFAILAKAAVSPIQDERRLRLVVTASAVAFCWHILFSPIASRIELSFTLGVILTQAVSRTRDAASASRHGITQANVAAEVPRHLPSEPVLH
jgi:hypothetical protein